MGCGPSKTNDPSVACKRAAKDALPKPESMPAEPKALASYEKTMEPPVVDTMEKSKDDSLTSSSSSTTNGFAANVQTGTTEAVKEQPTMKSFEDQAIENKIEEALGSMEMQGSSNMLQQRSSISQKAGDNSSVPLHDSSGVIAAKNSALLGGETPTSKSQKEASSLSDTSEARKVDDTSVDDNSAAGGDRQHDGCYLVFDERDTGTFYAKYSKTPVPEALAFCSVGELVIVPAFKYKTPVRIQSRVRAGRTNHFQAWCQWVKEARALEGSLVLLPAYEAMQDKDPVGFPPMTMYFLTGTAVKRVEKGAANTPFNLKSAAVVACVPEAYTGLDDDLRPGAEVQRSDFLSKVRVPQDKFYIEFSK